MDDIEESDHWEGYENWRKNRPEAIRERNVKEFKNFKNNFLIAILVIIILVLSNKCSSDIEGYTGNSEQNSN